MADLPYRTLAKRTLENAADILDDFPKQGLPSDLAAVRFAHAQVLATAAVAQALLNIGDVLREGFTRTTFDVEVD